MNFEDFNKRLSESEPPPSVSSYLKALWHDAKGDWEKAHTIIQDIEDSNGSWIHAYLHRKEGDIFNADYWYRRAGKKRPEISLEEEWTSIVKAMVNSE